MLPFQCHVAVYSLIADHYLLVYIGMFITFILDGVE